MSFLYFLEGLRCPFLDTLFSLITAGGEETLFMAVGMFIFWCVSKYDGYYLLCVGFCGTVINQFLKMLFRIPRPWVKDPAFTIVESARTEATGYSFPSGHTQTAIGLYGGVAKRSRNRYLRIAMIALCVLVPFSRMYLGVHTPTDVLVSVGIGLLLVFLAHPLFRRAEGSPKTMYLILFSLTGLLLLFLGFVFFYPFPPSVYTEGLHNLESARKNGVTLLGCCFGLLLTYTVDLRHTQFETKAVWWVQILKTVGGILLVLAAKELLRTPLEALFGNALLARGVRYFLIVVVGGVLWPMTFPFFAKLGKNKKEVSK